MRLLPCVYLKSSFALDCQGNVLPCLIWDKVLGNIRDYDYDVDKILKSRQAHDILSMVQDGKCPGCWTPCEAFQSIIDSVNYLLRR
ncbi:MAG: SPASM domain-containing protein [Candidatus Omnitrophota bacterium]